MHASVSAAGALHLHLFSEDLAGGLFQFAHDGPGVLLVLPAAVTGAVIFEENLEGSHRARMLRSDQLVQYGGKIVVGKRFLKESVTAGVFRLVLPVTLWIRRDCKYRST